MPLEAEEERLAQAVWPDVPRETLERLAIYRDEAKRWNASINLVAPSSIGDFWSRHICDSLQLCALGHGSKRWVDLGSGGGLPGLVLAASVDPNHGHVQMVESNRKKTAFLQQMIGRLSLPAKVHACRIEDAFNRTGPADLVTARALAPLDRLIELALPWLESGATALFPKGRSHRDEIEAVKRRYAFDCETQNSAIDGQSVILTIQNVRRV